MPAGTTALDVEAEALPAGFYVLRATGERTSKTATLTVLR